jgi:membrane protein implicated in regulation of membrane protease activity
MDAQPPGRGSEADAPLSFNERYWTIALPVWLIASGICAVVAAVGSPTWADAVAFAFGWGVFAIALWWTLDTVRKYRAGERAKDPRAILDERLASGEVSVEEYRERRQALDG